MTLRLCRECERHVDFEATHVAPRLGGGNYRRAGRFYLSVICTECVLELAARPRYAGTSLVHRWGASALQILARQIMTPAEA